MKEENENAVKIPTLVFMLLYMLIMWFISNYIPQDQQETFLNFSFTPLLTLTIVYFITRHKTLSILCAVFLGIQIFVMPFVYFNILDNNPNAFIVNTQLQNEIRLQNQIELKNQYHPTEQVRQIKFIKSLLLQYDLSSINMRKLHQDKVYQIPPYSIVLQNTSTPNPLEHAGIGLIGIPPPRPPREYFDETIRFIHSDPKLTTFITYNSKDIDINEYDLNLNLKTFLNKIIQVKNRKISDFNTQVLKIKAQRIWKFKYLFPQCLNITTSGNLVPANQTACLLIFLHRLIIDNITIGLILTIVYELFFKKKI